MNLRSPTREQVLAGWIRSGSARTWRVDAGHTRVKAARQLGVTENTLRRWEFGLVDPARGNWLRYYNYLKSIRPQEETCPQPSPTSSASDHPNPASNAAAGNASTA